MSEFESETAVTSTGEGTWQVDLSTSWNIGESANGGYAMLPVLRVLQALAGHADPISVTTHFLRPVRGGGSAHIQASLLRQGRSVSVATGTLHHAGADRVVVTAAFGDLDDLDDLDEAGLDEADPRVMEVPAPAIPPPADCVDRRQLRQGVDLPIASRIEVRIPHARTGAGESPEAVTEGWIRFTDGTPASTMALPLFADAFPPSLFAKLGRVGWVPTIELTVHVRRQPAEGWIQARFECDDLAGGRMIETGTLWDSRGHVVARSRQLGLLTVSDTVSNS